MPLAMPTPPRTWEATRALIVDRWTACRSMGPVVVPAVSVTGGTKGSLDDGGGEPAAVTGGTKGSLEDGDGEPPALTAGTRGSLDGRGSGSPDEAGRRSVIPRADGR
jgi:hypothetical protein